MPPSWPRRCHLFLGLLSLHPGKVLVVDVLIQVLVEDVADTAPPEGGVTLAPHDFDVGAVLGERLLLGLGSILAEPSLGTPRRCAQPRQS